MLKYTQTDMVIADKAYDGQARIVEPLLQADKAMVIFPKASGKHQGAYHRHMYKARHLIENFFARLKQYSAIAIRCGRTALNFLGALRLAAATV